ncbi:hypothetical protein DACRYDRAFT_24158 [Dacryopinax primogenitus]|uniref:Uncharacterized protein n=1 Tax=Dacryopinax primogenitus (strain DJM 731) TaxID=1858805 RepID=M5G5Q3_DACPD|nr:uncharacterized protein DACRYDRAFT_24158 [Dacryopinax primogenitus]EJT99092.1 hypothetical protein DACRYDRAFT_24158 [Dacryopinax primogenitus]
MSHSRSASNTVFSPDGGVGGPGPALNPHAKPFVFGTSHTRPGSFASNPLFPSSPPSVAQQNPYPTPSSITMHGKQASIPRLNAQAAEFKPTFSVPIDMPGQGFTFQPPPQAPSLTFDLLDQSTRVVDSVDSENEDDRAAQGREKRRRRTGESDEEDPESSEDDDEDDDKENESVPEESDDGNKRQRLAGFQFPPPQLPPPAHLQSSPFSRRMTLEPISTDFIFESPNWSARASAPALMPVPSIATDPEPLPRMPHSASIAAEFNHPIFTTKVPASLFKALNAYGSDNDSRGKRSRVHSSRDFLTDEDDLNDELSDSNAALFVSNLVDSTTVEASSIGQSRTLEMAIQQVPMSYAAGLVAPSHAVHRASSMPHMRTPSPGQDSQAVLSSSAPVTVEQMEELEERISSFLTQKMGTLTEVLTGVLAGQASPARPTDSPAFDVDALVQKVAEAVESRMQDNLPLGLHARSSSLDLGNSQLEILRKTMAAQYENFRQHLVEDLAEVCRETLATRPAEWQQTSDDTPILEAALARTEETITSTMSGFRDLLSNSNNLAGARTDDDRELLLSELSAMVLPQIASLRVEPLDVDVLTEQLSEAVKPHISQLIDLASDKKETAGLIVQRLGPILSSMMPAPLDVNAISEQMAGYVERLMPPPLNVKALKKDLVEGLTEVVRTQLAGAFEKQKLEEIVPQLKDHLQPVLALKELVPTAGTFDNLVVKQEELYIQNKSSIESTKQLHTSLRSMPEQLSVAIESLDEMRAQLAKGAQALGEIRNLGKLATENADLQQQLAEASRSAVVFQGEKVALESAVASAQSQRDTASSELRELRIELESWKIRALDNKTLRDDLEKQVAEKEVEVIAAKSATASSREKVAQVEADKNDVLENNLRLKAQISKLEREASSASKEVEVLREKVSHLEKSREEARAEQTHWDEIRRTAQQVEQLTKLISGADDEELQELRRQRDRAKVMEGEFAALKKRFDEQETKLANLQRNAITSKNSIAQVQQRSTEWEKKWHTAETELAQVKSERETSEQLIRQLETEKQMLRRQLDDGDRRETEYQIEQSSLQAEVQQLQQKVDFYSASEQNRFSRSASRASANGHSGYVNAPFPFRASTSMSSDDTAFSFIEPPERDSLPTPRGTSPPLQGLWASIHAPRQSEPERATTPKAVPIAPSFARSFSMRQNNRSASPALSSVSVAPTEGDDGWWS